MANAQIADLYRTCLTDEQQKAKDTAANACGMDAMILSNPGSYGNCVTSLVNQLTKDVHQRCQKDAEQKHYITEKESKKLIENSKNESKRKFSAFAPDDGNIDNSEPDAPKKLALSNAKKDVADKAREEEMTSEIPRDRESATAGESSFDSSAIEAEASADIASCDRSLSNASQCCNNPMSCAGSMSASDQASLANLFRDKSVESLSEDCRNMNNLAANYGNVNAGLSAVCVGSYTTCSSSCGELADKYNRLLSSCSDCAARSIYDSAYSALTSRRSSCQNLSSRADQLASSGVSTASNRAIAEQCAAQAAQQTAPSSYSSANNSYPDSSLPGSGAIGGSANPSVFTPTAYVREGERGTAGFRAATQQPKSDGFNVDGSAGFKGYGDSQQTATQNPLGGGPDGRPLAGLPGAASKGAVVPNNSGGAIPGQGSDSKPASLGARSAGPAARPANNSITDIDRGFQGGNGYSQPVGSNGLGESRGEQHYNRRRIAGNDNQFDPKIDLRQFLPGGSRAAARTIGGGQINRKEENLFRLISNKMIEKCRLGILWQCQ